MLLETILQKLTHIYAVTCASYKKKCVDESDKDDDDEYNDDDDDEHKEHKEG